MRKSALAKVLLHHHPQGCRRSTEAGDRIGSQHIEQLAGREFSPSIPHKQRRAAMPRTKETRPCRFGPTDVGGVPINPSMQIHHSGTRCNSTITGLPARTPESANARADRRLKSRNSAKVKRRSSERFSLTHREGQSIWLLLCPAVKHIGREIERLELLGHLVRSD